MPLKTIKKYISYFLLVTFSWAIVPTHTLHEIFADHNDTAHDYCAKFHAHLGLHVEKKHTHCEILKSTTPVYDRTNFFILDKIEPVFVAEIKSEYQSASLNQFLTSVPARGPPAI